MKSIEILGKDGLPVAKVTFPENTPIETVLSQIQAYSTQDDHDKKEEALAEAEATAWAKFKSWFTG